MAELEVGTKGKLPMSEEIATVQFIGKRFTTVTRADRTEARYPSEVLDPVQE